MSKPNINIIILAAGKGTRMHSNKPKVLHEVGGKPILGHVIDAAKALNPTKIIVIYGFGGELVKSAFEDEAIIWAEQKEQLGTGHAVQQALPYLDDHSSSLILLGDVPLIDTAACSTLLARAQDKLAIQSFNKLDPTGYGRIIRNENHAVTGIVEHKDATTEQHDIQEVNTGIMAMPTKYLKNWLNRLDNENAQQEYYLTDIVSFAVADKVEATAVITPDEWSVTGINSKVDLTNIERVYQQHQALHLLEKGVTLIDPSRIDIRGNLKTGRDVEIDIGCVFEGNVTLGDNVKIAANCVLKDCTVAAGTNIQAFSHIEQSEVGEDCRIGPYARLRPGTQLIGEAHIGNFVELKNAKIDLGSKVNHLSYVGDSEVGQKVNIGAGTITCNYDGANKFKTIIKDHVFVGSDTQLVAPVTIGEGATIAAGSTITKNVPADSLTICRAKQQRSISGWKRPTKMKKES